MKRKNSTKNQVIALMQQNPEGITYTEIVKLILAVTQPQATYNWKFHRGYWATNLGDKGYMRSGGDGYLYKYNGRWFAKWYDKGELLQHRIERELELATAYAGRLGVHYGRFATSTNVDSSWESYRSDLKDLKDRCTKKIAALIKADTKKNK